MIDVKSAVKVATAFFVDVMGEKISDVWLEEVRTSSDGEKIYVTLSALAPTRKDSVDDGFAYQSFPPYGGTKEVTIIQRIRG